MSGEEHLESPVPERPSRAPGRRAAVLAAGTAAVVAAGGVAYAATGTGGAGRAAGSGAAPAASGSPTPSASATPGAPGGDRRGAPGMHRGRFGPHGAARGFGAFRLGEPLHGRFTVAAPGGGYRTVDVQLGSVRSVSATAVTVRSADGYTVTYTVGPDTLVDAGRAGIDSVATGHRVVVLARKAAGSGGRATAVRIADRTLRRDALPRRGAAAPDDSSGT